MKKLIIATAILSSLSVHAGVGRYDRSVTQHKEFALQSKFDFACHLNSGSATLIDPFWLVTANHVSGSKADNYENRASCGSFEKQANGVYKQILSESAKTDPNGQFGEYNFPYFNDRGFGDFALVRLDTPIRNIKPAKLPKEGMFDYSKAYEVYQVGYGNYNGRNGGTKQVIHSAEEDRWLAEYSHTPTTLEQTNLNWLAIHGDSGSGITAEIDGELYLIGEIGLQYSTSEIGGWTDTFDDVIARLPFIHKTMKEHGFSYVEAVNYDFVKWTPTTQDTIEDLHAFYSTWRAHNFDFNDTYWTDDGGVVNTAYGQPGETYSIEIVIPKKKTTPAFDIFVEGRAVAVDINVNQAETNALLVTINAFKLEDDLINVEFKPVGDLSGKGNIAIDHFLIKAVK